MLAEDQAEELFSEVRGRADVAGFDLDVVQVLETEHVSSSGVGFGDDPAEEHPQLLQPGRGSLRRGIGERKIHIDAIHAVQAEISQVFVDKLLEVGPWLLDPHEGEVVVLTYLDAQTGGL